MLSRPHYGWSNFTLGDHEYPLSYLTNIPWEWLDRAIFGLETLLPFEVSGYCEPGRMICTVDLSECRIVFEDDNHRKDDASVEIVPTNMLDFCKMLHADISDHLDAWQQWNSSYEITKADLQAKLDRLQKLMDFKANCFI